MKVKGIKAISALVIISLCALQNIKAQTILTNIDSVGVFKCIEIEMGTSMTFQISDVSCGYGLAVDFDHVGSPINDGISDEQIALFYNDGAGGIDIVASSSLGYVDVAISDNQFTLTFNELGFITFQCDVPENPIFGVAGIANQCLSIVEPEEIAASGGPSPIPTLGEWGIIILGLILSIVGVMYYRSSIAASEKA